jgi:hypothetical protein
LADAQITDGEMCAMVNARFQTRFTRRIVSMWRNSCESCIDRH